MNFLITGGAGFIGSAVIRYILNNTSDNVLNVDKLTYAGNLESLCLNKDSSSPQYRFVKADICNKKLLEKMFAEFQPDVVMHLAAESHVDRSIDDSELFIQTNIIGTYSLLEVTRRYWQSLSAANASKFRFHHISTDEVYGDLEGTDDLFLETTAYSPSSPYSASKASSDHLVRAWHRTYGLPVVITNCSNNYGPLQYPEKLIPLMILNAIQGKSLPVYGNGMQVRDWLHVEDHARALVLVAKQAKLGETYNIGGHNEINNIDVVKSICQILEKLVPNKPKGVIAYEDLISFVSDRPGHDKRYAIDASKIKRDLGWVPEETFATGLYKTVLWYLENKGWLNKILNTSKA